jgi:hypothetical protein
VIKDAAFFGRLLVRLASGQSFFALLGFVVFHGLIVKAGLETRPKWEAIRVAMCAANETQSWPQPATRGFLAA